MTLIDTATLFIMMAGLATLPSASVALVVVHSASVGVRSGLAVSAGIVAGDLIFATFAILGLGALADVMGSVFVVIRYLAAAYLIWLGIGLIRSASLNASLVAFPIARGLGGGFIAGLALTLSDVKAILFYASLFPAFVDLASLTAADTALIMIVTVVAVGGVKVLYAFSARPITQRLGDSRFKAPAQVAAGGAMLGAGGYLLAKT